MKKHVVLEPQVHEKLNPQNVEERVLSDLDKRMEEILNSKLPMHEKIELYYETLQKSKLYKKSKPNPKKKKKSLTETSF